MFELLVQKAISKFVGTYVENLSGKDLQINVLKGDVNLKNLRLKRTALDEFSHLIPLKILRGSIGHIKLNVNFKKLIKSPIVVEISDVVIVVCSRHSEEHDHERERVNARQALKKQLQARLNKQLKGLKSFKKKAKLSRNTSFKKGTRVNNGKGGGGGRKSKSGKKENGEEQEEQGGLTKLMNLLKSFHSSPVSRKLIETIAKNMTVSINNVHVRYEEVARISSHAKAPSMIMGVTMKSLQMFSCDEQWEQVHMSSSKGPCFKKVKFDDLAVYSSENNPYTKASLIDDQEFVERMLREIPDSTDKHYLLYPSSMLAKFVMFLQKPDPDRPRIQGTVDMDNLLRLEFSNNQYRSILNTASYFVNFKQYEQYRALRPALSTNLATQDGRLDFWRFALGCIRMNVNQAYFSNEQLKQRQTDQQQYIALLKRRAKANSSLTTSFSSSNKKAMESIEGRYDFDDLAFWQDIAFREMEKRYSKNTTQQPQSSETIQEVDELGKMTAVTDNDMQELYNTLEFDEGEEKMIRQSMEGQKFSELDIKIRVHHIDVAIHHEKQSERLLSIQCSDITCGMTLHSDLSIDAQSSLRSLCISSAQKDLILTSMQENNANQRSLKEKLVRLEVRKMPDNVISIMARLSPVELVVPSPSNIQRIASFALVDPTSSDTDINSLIASVQAFMSRANAQKTLRDAGTMAQQTMRSAMKKQALPLLKIDIEMAPSRMVVSPASSEETASPVFMIYLSKLKIQEVRGPSADQQNSDVQNFSLSFSEANLSVQSAKTLSPTPLLPEPLSAEIFLTITSNSDDESVPVAAIDAKLSSVRVQTSMQTVRDILSLATAYLPVLNDLGGRVENADMILSTQGVALNAPFNALNSPWVRCDIDLKSACCVVIRKTNGGPHSIIWLRNAVIEDISETQHTYFNQEVEHVVKIALPRLTTEQLFFIAFPSENVKKKWLKEMSILAMSSNANPDYQFDAMVDLDDDETTTTTADEWSSTLDSEQNETRESRSSISSSVSVQKYSSSRPMVSLRAILSSADVVFEASSQLSIGIHVADMHAQLDSHLVSLNEAQFSVARATLRANGNEVITLVNTNPNSKVVTGTVHQYYDKSITDAPPFAVVCNVKIAPIGVQLTQQLVHNIIPVGVETLDILGDATAAKVMIFSALDRTLSSLSEYAYSGTNALDLKIDGHLASVKISVIDNGHDFLSAETVDLNLAVKLEQSTLILSGNVHKFEATDISEPSMPLTIVTTESDKQSLPFVNFEVVQHLNNAITNLNSPFYLRTVSATVRPLRFVVYMLFVRRVMLFAFEGLVWRKSLNSLSGFSLGTLINKFMKPGVRKMRLEVTIIRPTVVIPDYCDYPPEKRTSIAATIEKINISNRLHERFIYTNNWREEFTVALSGIKANSAVSGDTLVTPLLHPLDVRIALDKSAVLSNIPEMPKTTVSVECEDVNFTLSHMQYQILWRILDHNVKRFTEIKTQFAIETAGLMEVLKYSSKSDANTMSSVPFPMKRLHEEAVNDIETKLTVALPKVSLTLRRGTGNTGYDDIVVMDIMESRAMISIEVESAEIDRKSHLTVEASIANLHIKDARISTDSQFRSVVVTDRRMDEGKEKANLLTASILNFETIEIQAASLEITVGSTIFAELALFAAQRYPPSSTPPISSDLAEPIGTRLSQKDGQYLITDPIVHLSRDIKVTSQKPMVVENMKGHKQIVVIDGCGNSIFLVGENNVRIDDNITLVFRNIVLRCASSSTEGREEEILSYFDIGNGSSVVHALSMGVVQRPVAIKQGEASDRIIDKELKDSQKPSYKLPVDRSVVISAQIGSDIRPLRVIIPEAIDVENSAYMVLEVAASAHYSLQRGYSDSALIHISKLRAGIEGNKPPLVDDFAMSIDMLGSLDQPIHSRTFGLTVAKPLSVRVSFDEVKLFLKVATRMKDSLAASRVLFLSDYGFEVMVMNENGAINLSTMSVDRMDSMDLESMMIGSSDSTDIASATEFDEFLTLNGSDVKRDMEFRVTAHISHLLSLFMVDNSRGYDIPLLNANVAFVVINSAEFQLMQQAAHAEISFQASVNNCVDFIDWQPLVEPLNGSVLMARTKECIGFEKYQHRNTIRAMVHGSADPGCQDVVREPINITVSKHFLSSMFTTMKAWKEELQSEEGVGQGFASFMFRNHSGTDVEIFISKKADGAFVQSGNEYTFDMFTPQLIHEADASKVVHIDHLFVYLSIPGFTRKPPIDLRVKGARFLINQRTGDRYIIEVRSSMNRTLLILRSQYSIKNLSNIAWQLGVKRVDEKSSGGQMVTPIGQILPNDTAGVPILEDLDNYTILLRPSDEHEWSTVLANNSRKKSPHKWSALEVAPTMGDLAQLSSSDMDFALQFCSCKEGSSEAHHIVMRVRYAAVDGAQSLRKQTESKPQHIHDYTLSLQAPIVVENLLSMSIRFKLRSKPYKDSVDKYQQMKDLQSGTLQSGGKLYCYSLDLRHVAYLTASCNSQSSSEDVCIFGKSKVLSREMIMPFSSTSQVSVRLKYLTNNVADNREEPSPAFHDVELFVPYWFVNHTEHVLMVTDGKNKDNKARVFASDKNDTHTSNNSMHSIVMFDFARGPSSKNRVTLALEEPTSSKASKTFSVDAINITQQVDVSTKEYTLPVGVLCTLGPGRFSRTTIVQFGARFVVVNRLDVAIRVRTSAGRKSLKKASKSAKSKDVQEWVYSVDPKEDASLSWLHDTTTPSKEHSICVTADAFLWSQPIQLGSQTTIPFKLFRANNASRFEIINAIIQQKRMTTVVALERCAQPPFKFHNRTFSNFSIQQRGCTQQWTLIRRSSVSYALDDHTKSSQVTITQVSDSVKKESITVDLTDAATSHALSLQNGWKVDINIKIKGRTNIVILTMSKTGTTASSAVANRPEKKDKHQSSHRNLTQRFHDTLGSEQPLASLFAHVSGIGISLVDSVPREFSYLFVKGINAKLHMTNQYQVVSLNVGSLQVDNQLQDAVYPVVLTTGDGKSKKRRKKKSQTQILKTKDDDDDDDDDDDNSDDSDEDVHNKKFLRILLARSTTQKTVLKLAECAIEVNRIKVEIDTQFAITFGSYALDILDMLQHEADEELTESRNLLAIVDRGLRHRQIQNVKSKTVPYIFFKHLYISPIRLIFTLNIVRSTIPDRLQGSAFFQTVIRFASLSAPIISLDEAQISLNVLELFNLNTNPPQLAKQLFKHYTRRAVWKLLGIIGQLDIIGSPVSFFRDVGSATRSLSSGSFGDMATHSFHGMFYGMSRISSSYSKAFGQISLDGNYLRDKEKRRSQRAHSPVGGFRQGAASLVRGLFEGTTGIVTKPIRGAASGGAGGAMKGAVLGVVGLAAKPVSGGFDFLSKTTEGWANLRNEARQGRYRLPRPFGEHGSVIVYTREHALVQYVVDRALRQEIQYRSDLRSLKGSTIKRAHFYIADTDKSVVVLTDDSVLKCTWRNQKLLWQYYFWQIREVTRSSENDGIGIVLQLNLASTKRSRSNITQHSQTFGNFVPKSNTEGRKFYDLFFSKLHARHHPFHAVQDTQRKRSTAVHKS